ncbi:MAG: NAD-dependent deacylase [Chloroflexi bacterium]|nr:NAD-dependent deacylase [Chloroflexota bacterium]
MTDSQRVPPIPESDIAEVAAVLRRSARPVVLTGAGVSKESGIPTFRDALDGLWAQFDPQQLATPRAFRRNPKLVWDWYQYRRELLAEARPNPAHRAIAEIETVLPQLVVITQNIDGLHAAAGSSDVITLHGDIRRNKCFANCQGDPTLIDVAALAWDREHGPPRCPHCGAWVRPDVVWFEEMLPAVALERAYDLSHATDLMLVVGTSGVVQPAASLPFAAKQHGATIVEVNPEMTSITLIADWHLSGQAGAILPLIVAALRAVPDRPPEGPPHA